MIRQVLIRLCWIICTVGSYHMNSVTFSVSLLVIAILISFKRNIYVQLYMNSITFSVSLLMSIALLSLFKINIYTLSPFR